MEEEEVEIRRLIVRKNLDLILDEHIKIDGEHYKSLDKEYRQVLKKELSEEESEPYTEFL